MRIVSHGRFDQLSKADVDPDMREAFSVYWRSGFGDEAGAGVALSRKEAMDVVEDFFKEGAE